MSIPPGVRKMVTETTEDWVRDKGEKTVTLELFNALAEENGMDADFFERFNAKKKKRKKKITV
jgi:hypothetical protein